MEIKVMSCTGHRPPKLNGEYDYDGPCSEYLISEITRILIEEKPDKAVSGMAIGSDTLFALVCLELGIPLLAAIPFIGQEKKWPAKSQRLYNKILNNLLTTIHIVSEGDYSIAKMHIRDEFMIDKLTYKDSRLLAIYDGSGGGTHYTVQYAIKNNKNIIYINPNGWKKPEAEQPLLFN